MNNVGLKLGFLGIGQCGGNIANEFAKIGYKSIAINTSSTDLSKLDHIHETNQLLISTGIQGAGKNPEFGKQALEEHIEDVMHLISQVFDEDMDMLFVCAGLGGGTGSGIAPLLTQILTEQGQDTGMVVTIPSQMESPKVKIVALTAFEELSQNADLGTVFVVDNSKTTNLPSTMGIQTKYNIVNENVARKLHAINEISTMPSEVSFDARDFKTLLEARGSALITTINIEDIAELKEDAFLAMMAQRTLKDTIYAATDFKHAKGCAFLFELPEGGSNFLTEDSFYKMQREFGTPFETFMGLYERKQKGRDVTLSVLLTGLPFPQESLTTLRTSVEEQANNLESLFDTSENQKFSGGGSELMNRFVKKPGAKKDAKQGDSTLDRLLSKKKKK